MEHTYTLSDACINNQIDHVLYLHDGVLLY